MTTSADLFGRSAIRWLLNGAIALSQFLDFLLSESVVMYADMKNLLRRQPGSLDKYNNLLSCGIGRAIFCPGFSSNHLEEA